MSFLFKYIYILCAYIYFHIISCVLRFSNITIDPKNICIFLIYNIVSLYLLRQNEHIFHLSIYLQILLLQRIFIEGV